MQTTEAEPRALRPALDRASWVLLFSPERAWGGLLVGKAPDRRGAGAVWSVRRMGEGVPTPGRGAG